MSTSTFVAMGTKHAQFGIHAQLVQAIVTEREWEGVEPLDVAAALCLTQHQSDARGAVLLVGTNQHPSPIRALGTVVLRQVDVAHVWPVPHCVRNPSVRQTVAAVAFFDGEPPLLVLDPIALLAMAVEHV